MDIPGAKYSHAIYTSYLTGQLTTNYKGDPIIGSFHLSFDDLLIEGDHWVRSMKRSDSAEYNLRYIGPEWSFLAIFGKDNYDTFFDEWNIQVSNQFYQHT